MLYTPDNRNDGAVAVVVGGGCCCCLRQWGENYKIAADDIVSASLSVYGLSDFLVPCTCCMQHYMSVCVAHL